MDRLCSSSSSSSTTGGSFPDSVGMGVSVTTSSPSRNRTSFESLNHLELVNHHRKRGVTNNTSTITVYGVPRLRPSPASKSPSKSSHLRNNNSSGSLSLLSYGSDNEETSRQNKKLISSFDTLSMKFKNQDKKHRRTIFSISDDYDDIVIKSNISDIRDSTNDIIRNKKKKIASKVDKLKPQLKAFKRVANDLQLESMPLENEIKTEAFLAYALKDETLKNSEIIKKNFNSGIRDKNYLINQSQETMKKTKLVAKVNEDWSTRHNSVFNDENDNSIIHPNTLLTLKPRLKRRVIDSDDEEGYSSANSTCSIVSNSSKFSKRRVVINNSPIQNLSPLLYPKKSSKLVNSASEDLGKMCLH